MADSDDKKDGQQQLGADASAVETVPTTPAKGGAKKTTSKKPAEKSASQPGSKQLTSFSEYRATAGREEVTLVLEKGFRVWMKTVKQEPLSSRTFSDWDELIDQYLRS